MNPLILTPKEMKEQEQIREHGRVIAQGMQDVKVEHQKNMAKAEKRKATMLERAAEIALSGR
jgi:hypothetical protein